MTYDGAELAPCRKEKWKGGGGALASGLCELSCGVVVTFMAVPLPLVKNPWGKDHSWSQMHMRGQHSMCQNTSCRVASLAGGLCRADAASMGPPSCLQHLTRDVCCWWGGGEGVYLILEVCSLVTVLFLYCSLTRRRV